jgi:hypothetical protein
LDFGLAKLTPQYLDLYAITMVLGTFGYFEPEYALVMYRPRPEVFGMLTWFLIKYTDASCR